MSDFVSTISAPLDISDPDLIRRIAEYATARGFQKNMRVLGDKPLHEVDRGGLVADLADRATPPNSSVACLARCFVLDVPTAEAAMREHLGNDFVDACLDIGLFERRGENVLGAICILPGDVYTNFCDHRRPDENDGMEQFVMGPALSTKRLIGSLPKRNYRRFLDLCSGSAAAAFSAAPRAEAAVAADYNERALNLARFGAAWNGLRNIDVRFTDRFSAVANETFDLIACNPPFAINPDVGIMFLSGRMRGDGFCEQIFRGIPAHLNEGGFAHVLCDVARTTEQSPLERFSEWVAGAGCDALLIADQPKAPREYAESWLGPIAQIDAQRYKDERTRWIQFYSDSGFLAFQHYMAVLRKRTPRDGDSPNWVHTTDRLALQDNFGHHILRLFANEDLIRQGDSALLASRLKLAPDAALEVHFQPGDRAWNPTDSSLRLTGGIDQQANVPHALGLAVAELDGTMTVTEFIDSFATQIEGGDPPAVQKAVLQAVTQMLRFGFLAPVEFFATEGAA